VLYFFRFYLETVLKSYLKFIKHHTNH
jgi:hypothetical protein